jgi:dTDP-L-rhamnose 4-epimerase
MPQGSPYAGVASIFRSSLEAGGPPRVFEDGAQVRDFVHVRDVAHANVLALETGAEGAFNIASGEPHTILDMAVALVSAVGDPTLEPVVTGGYRLGDVRHVVASPRRAAEVLGFVAGVGFAEGMREFVAAPLRSPAS